MKRFAMAPVVAMMAMALGGSMAAQKTTELKVGGGGSPHVRTDYTIDGAKLSVEYGRPSLKGRPESQMMPAGKPWRMGADEATILTTDKAIKIGTTTLEPGTYTLNAQPGEKEWHLLVGKLGKPGQWGIPYNSALEIARVPMTLGKAKAPMEQVTITIDDTKAGALLRVEWGMTSATVPFTVG